MSYSTGEANILTIIQAMSGYDSNNTSRADWKILDTGRAAYYVVIKPGDEPAPFAFVTFNAYQVDWTTVLQVWYRYQDEKTTSTNLFTQVQAVITALQVNNKLDDTGNTIVNAEIISITPPLERWTRDGGPIWLAQDITVRWTEITNITLDS